MTNEEEFVEINQKETQVARAPWWKGARGEGYVVVQLVLFAMVAFAPRTWPGLPAWPPPLTIFAAWVGGLFILVGGLLIFSAIFKLGANITAVPYPKEKAILVETGPYRIVRHPIYSGGILAAFGWAFWVHGWLTLAYALVLLAFFDIKSRREEQWLTEKFSNYPAYQSRVRKLIPFIY